MHPDPCGVPIELDRHFFVEYLAGNVIKSGVTVEVWEDEWLHDGGHQHGLPSLGIDRR